MDIILKNKNGGTLNTANKYCEEDIRVLTETQRLEVNPSTETQSFDGFYGEVIVDGDKDLKPENIKMGVNIFGIDGDFDAVDTRDADATANDIITGKTAYVNNEKVQGNFEPLDTSDADATAEDIAINKIAYVKDQKIVGTSANNAAFKNPEGTTTNSFSAIQYLTSINNFDTSELVNITSLFENAKSIQDVSSLKFPKATNYTKTFMNCSSLKKLVIDAPNCISFNRTATDCTSLETIEIGNSKSGDFGSLCYGCINLKSAKIGTFSSSCFKAGNMFENCELLETLTIGSGFSIDANLGSMFKNCKKLKEGIIVNCGSSSSGYGNKTSMYQGCSSLEKIVINPGYSAGSFQTSQSYSYICDGCTNLKTVEFIRPAYSWGRWEYAFRNCTNLESFPFSDIIFMKNGSYAYMFEGSGLRAVNGMQIQEAGSSTYVFKDCVNLTQVDISFKVAQSLQYWFSGCTSLTEIPECILNSGYQHNVVGAFENSGITRVPKEFLEKFISYNYTFRNCTNLTTVEAASLQKVTSPNSVASTFAGCSNLTDESLNNIMASLITLGYTGTSNYKTLKYIGLSSEQATRCQSLSNYQAFLDAGWKTGY